MNITSITSNLNRALKLHGMTCRYIPADCPSVDDQIEIYNADGSESVVHLQLCACGEFSVGEWVDGGDAMLHHPSTRNASKAVALAASRAIVRQLSELSRDGWSHATHVDYVPLETELRALADKLTGERP